MSIIQEALKKVGEEDGKSEAKPAEATSPSEPIAQEHPTKTGAAAFDTAQSKSVKIVYSVTVAVLAAILAGILIIAFRAPVPHAKNRIVSPPILLPKIEPAPPRREAERAENRHNIGELGGFILDGIMYIADSPRAIINNIIVGEGETVNGANVEKIKKDSVVLKYNESEVTLKLNK